MLKKVTEESLTKKDGYEERMMHAEVRKKEGVRERGIEKRAEKCKIQENNG